MKPFSRETIVERRQPLIRWSAVFAGTAVAIGLWILLQVLGMGIGLAAVDTDDPGSLRAAGIGTGIWSVIAPLIAMFLGAMLAGRLCGSRDRKVGAMHGGVLWALATVLGLWAMLGLVSAMASGVARVGGAAAGATSAMVSGAAGGADEAMSALGIGPQDLVAPINERLESQGMPPITSRQLANTVRAVAQRGLRGGELDREVLVQELERNTALSRTDAEDIADQFGERYQALATRVGDVGERAQEVGLAAADKAGKALLLGGLMMLLSLGAAIGGGLLGVSRPREIEEEHVIRDEHIIREEPVVERTVRREP
jgi:hypothetical protein